MVFVDSVITLAIVLMTLFTAAWLIGGAWRG
jgi:hypothetical protein